MSNVIEKTSELVIMRTFRAPREHVFNAFASYDALKNWMCPHPCQVQQGKVDFREGGAYELYIDTPMGPVWLKGVYKEIKRPERLVYTFQWMGNPEIDGPETLVTLDFLVENGNTILRLRHTGLKSPESRDNHHEGWNGSFDRLLLRFHQCVIGLVGWNELMTQDAGKALAFYKGMFGWQTMPMPVGDRTYTILLNGPEVVGGMMEYGPEHAEMSSRWNTYINVENLEVATARAAELGGQVVVPPTPVGNFGRLAVVVDPAGASISLWQNLVQ